MVAAEESSSTIRAMRWTIWYHLHNFKNVKNTNTGVLLLVLKVTLLHGCFSRFSDCTNGIKLRKTSLMLNRSEIWKNFTINYSHVFQISKCSFAKQSKRISKDYYSKVVIWLAPSEAFSEPCQTVKMELSKKIVNGF